MKKILQRTLIVLGVFTVVIVAAVVSLTRGGEENTGNAIVTDAAGSTYYIYEDKEKDTTYAVVTDADGNRFAAEFDGNTVGSTVENINNKLNLEDVPTNYTGQHTEVTANVNDYTGAVVITPPTGNGTTAAKPQDTESTTAPANQGGTTTAPATPGSTTTAPAKPDTPTTTAPAAPGTTAAPALAAYRINKYQQLFASGTYLMEFTDLDLSDKPVTMAVKNGNMYVDVSMEGMALKMLYKNDVKTMYLIIDEFKKYCKLPEDLLGEDMDIGAMLSDFGVSAVDNITVSEVELNGQKLILESYVDGDGVQYNYYFNGEDLVRRDTVYTDGTTESMFISKFTTDVPDSILQIPEGYGYLNLSWMGAMM